MKQMSPTRIAIAVSTFGCAALLSFGWSEQRGLSLSVEKAEARVGRPLTPVSVAGVARRHNRRGVYGAGYGAGAVGAGAVAVGTAAAIGTAGAVAATSPNWGWGGNPYQTGTGYYAGGPYYGGPVRGAGAAYYGGGPNNRGGLVGGDDSGTYAGGPVRGANAAYYGGGYQSAAVISTTPHYAVKAYYAGGPWYNYSGWDDYRARNGIGCTPGTLTKLADEHMYVCQ